MRIKQINIKNFKTLVDFTLQDLTSFCAFVGPNASGKSNIFEALEFTNHTLRYSFDSPASFGGKEAILSFNSKPLVNFLGTRDLIFEFEFEDGMVLNFDATFSREDPERLESIGNSNGNKNSFPSATEIRNKEIREKFISEWKQSGNKYENDFEQFVDNFSRIFVGKPNSNKGNQPSIRLRTDASNLSNILGKIFEDNLKREDFIEWLRILIPEFRNIEIKKSNIDGSFEFYLFEKSSSKPFPKYLISDGTYNIIALMAAVYQTNQPQFLCIEEPENGLHPQAIQLMVDFFRQKCEDEEHHIWLNTHSQTLVSCLDISEIILVNKVKGETKARQFTKEDNIDIKTDEAWLTNMLGGGVLWSK